MMKRALRCHDFGSGREASRSPYRQYWQYWQGERQSHGPKLVPAPGLSSDIQPSAPGLRPKSATRRSVEQGPRLRGCDRAGAWESRALGRSTVPLRGRIQAHDAWNLLRPARDTLSAGLAIYDICPAPSFASSPILARNARVFHCVRGSKRSRNKESQPFSGTESRPEVGVYSTRCLPITQHPSLITPSA